MKPPSSLVLVGWILLLVMTRFSLVRSDDESLLVHRFATVEQGHRVLKGKMGKNIYRSRGKGMGMGKKKSGKGMGKKGMGKKGMGSSSSESSSSSDSKSSKKSGRGMGGGKGMSKGKNIFAQPTSAPSSSPRPSASVQPTLSYQPSGAPTLSLNPTISPAPTASLQPSISPTAVEIPVQIVEFYIAYVIPQLAATPSDAEFDELLAVTNTFFTEHLETTFEGNSTVQFDRLEMEIVETRFEADIPAERFNVYMELDAVAFYTGRSTPPLPLETLMILVEADFREYILDFVRPLGTTFVATNEVLVAELGFVEDS